MDLWERIAAGRRGYGVRCGLRSDTFASPESLAQAFGLRSEANIYRQIDADAARHVLCKLLHEDMAYASELVPVSDATKLAEAFVELFHDQNPRFYTNGDWHLPPRQTAPQVWTGSNWTPATDATFDAGILVLGNRKSGCAWFEDED